MDYAVHKFTGNFIAWLVGVKRLRLNLTNKPPLDPPLSGGAKQA